MTSLRGRVKTSTLEVALESADQYSSSEAPRALPFGHTTSVVHLQEIMKSGALDPQYCRVMRRKALYLFYGGLFYRSASKPTQEAAEYPVGFLFHPKICHSSDTYFPFDTGALVNGSYGALPQVFRRFRETLRVGAATLRASEPSHCPRILVKHLFGDNLSYLAGRPDVRAGNKPRPLPDLLHFFLAPSGRSDHRRACIENQRILPLALADDLLWIGYPDVLEDMIQRHLRTIEPHVPRTWPYPSYSRFRPSEICAQLDARARDVLDAYLVSARSKVAVP
jgi:hypothetical protein